MAGSSRHNSQFIRRKNAAKFENDSIFLNDHIINITQPNLMIYRTSFPSAEDVLSTDVKIFKTFSSQCTENPPFLFYRTPGIGSKGQFLGFAVTIAAVM